MEEIRRKNCRYCGEEIREEAIKCRYCLSMLDEAKGEPMREQQQEIYQRKAEEYTTETLYPKAGLGKRFIAFLVDAMVASLGLLIFLPVLVARIVNIAGRHNFMYGNYHSSFPFNHNYLPVGLVAGIGLFLLLGGMWAVTYHLIKDGFGRGQSLGKRFAGLMVVQLDNNEPCNFGSSFLRNVVYLFFNIIPGIGFFVEPIVLVLHEKGQRLGDLLGKTQVIDVQEYRR